mmetsp:Transcript_25216/g.37160  ORF Transcript_25216/g.37160 Transcript_25216/m.37160 type:complete len:618 (-) Transcript_25216:1416-3269(-)
MKSEVHTSPVTNSSLQFNASQSQEEVASGAVTNSTGNSYHGDIELRDETNAGDIENERVSQSDSSHTNQNAGCSKLTCESQCPQINVCNSQIRERICAIAVFVDILSSWKLLIMPLLILWSVGSPKYIFFIWPLWGLFNFGVYGLYFLSEDMDESIYEKYPEWLQHIANTTRCSKLVARRILIVWSCGDIFLSVLCFTVAFVMMNLIFVDSDGTLCEGWRQEYVAGVIQLFFCTLSVVCRVSMLASLPCGCTVAPTDRNDTKRDALLQYCVALSPIMCGLCIFCVVLSVVFLSVTLHDFLKSEFYYTHDGGDKGCDPMVPQVCALPYPSSHFLRPDPSTQTGFRVAIPDRTLPFLRRGVRMTASYSANRYDGFSMAPMLLWYLPKVQDNQLVSYDNIEMSVVLNSTTLLIETSSGALHPHFTEKDYIDEEADRIAYINPASALRYNTTYLAVVQNLTDSNGIRLIPSALMQSYVASYLSGSLPTELSSDERFRRCRDYYFPLLESMGVRVIDLQLIWDFHTASQESLLQDLEPVAELTKSLLVDHTQKKESALYETTSVFHDSCSNGNGKIDTAAYYTLSVPWYLNSHKRQKSYLNMDIVQGETPEFSFSSSLLLQV